MDGVATPPQTSADRSQFDQIGGRPVGPSQHELGANGIQLQALGLHNDKAVDGDRLRLCHRDGGSGSILGQRPPVNIDGRWPAIVQLDPAVLGRDFTQDEVSARGCHASNRYRGR